MQVLGAAGEFLREKGLVVEVLRCGVDLLVATGLGSCVLAVVRGGQLAVVVMPLWRWCGLKDDLAELTGLAIYLVSGVGCREELVVVLELADPGMWRRLWDAVLLG